MELAVMAKEGAKARVISKLLMSCIVYALISHYVLSVSYDSLNWLESGVRSLIVYTVMFLGYSSVPMLVGLGIAKIPPSNRIKPITPYFNGALVFTWIIVLVFLYAGWYGSKRAEETDIDINAIVQNLVDEIAVQLPMRMNRNTQFSSAIYINDSVYFNYLIESISQSDIDQSKFDERMKVFVHNRFCTDPDMEVFIKYARNIEVHWEYTDAQGVVLSNIAMTAADCGP
jgi:hypothetical protein